ncbi:MAG: CHAD domain-containing protein [Melioribacteraceae bacterium]|nr:CHAD domain-containing protein [Melioribacteraceae bacterium]
MIPKKWKINGLKKQTTLKKAAGIIIRTKLVGIFNLIDKFFKNDSDKSLHNLRIAVRKLRYTMEVFGITYTNNSYVSLYNKLKFLQDLIGEGRDMDVMRIKVEEIGNDLGISVPKNFFDSIDNNRMNMRRKIKEELIKFKESKTITKFTKKREAK